jgi:DNA polymerase-1
MTLLLVDGDHNLHRALHVQKFLEMEVDGQLTGGALGALSAIRYTLEEFRATRCVVVWDHGKSTFRRGIYPEYKAHREGAREEEIEKKKSHRRLFKSQKALLLPILRSLGVHCVELDGVEGDDLIYLVSTRFLSGMGEKRCVVMSEDMDLAQLVSETTRLHQPGKQQTVDLKNFEKVVGVRPESYVLWKAMVGDTSDNIKGVHGIGKKRATELLQELTSPDMEFYIHCRYHKTATVRRVAERWLDLQRNMRLMDLSEYPWDDADVEAVRRRVTEAIDKDFDRVQVLFKTLQYHSLLSKFSSWVSPFRRLK